MPAAESIDAYIADFPPEVQERLQALRRTIAKVAPEATEAISYAIPCFRLNATPRKARNLVHFAGFRNHVSMFPRSAAAETALGKELEHYASGRGTLLFKHSEPLPLELIEKFVEVRRSELNSQA